MTVAFAAATTSPTAIAAATFSLSDLQPHHPLLSVRSSRLSLVSPEGFFLLSSRAERCPMATCIDMMFKSRRASIEMAICSR
jgi:hypothetical protein